MKFTYKDFLAKYPNDDICLEKIFQLRYGNMKFCPECAAETTFYRVKRRRCYECKHCGYQVFPTAGTVFEKTRTNLTKWFHAMYLMTSSKNGVSAKEIERHLGVTYKCAWRMAHQLRILMGEQSIEKLAGNVQIDEAFLGGYRRGKNGRGAGNKTIVLGMVEDGGKVVTKVIPTLHSEGIFKEIKEAVAPGAHVTTDEFLGYRKLPTLDMTHDVVQHRLKEFVNKAGNHTNTIEGFWSILKRSISGTHVSVSPKHLPKYLNEFEFRYNNRRSIEPMFEVAFEALRPSSVDFQSPPNGSGSSAEAAAPSSPS